MNRNIVYKVTVSKLVLSGVLAGLTVEDSWNVDGEELGAEIERLNAQAGVVRKMCGSSSTYKQVGYKYEGVRA